MTAGVVSVAAVVSFAATLGGSGGASLGVVVVVAAVLTVRRTGWGTATVSTGRGCATGRTVWQEAGFVAASVAAVAATEEDPA